MFETLARWFSNPLVLQQIVAAAAVVSAFAAVRSSKAAKTTAARSIAAAEDAIEALGRVLHPDGFEVRLGRMSGDGEPLSFGLVFRNVSPVDVIVISVSVLWPGAATPVRPVVPKRLAGTANPDEPVTHKVLLDDVPPMPAPSSGPQGRVDAPDTQIAVRYRDERGLIEWEKTFTFSEHVLVARDDKPPVRSFQSSNAPHPVKVDKAAPPEPTGWLRRLARRVLRR